MTEKPVQVETPQVLGSIKLQHHVTAPKVEADQLPPGDNNAALDEANRIAADLRRKPIIDNQSDVTEPLTIRLDTGEYKLNSQPVTPITPTADNSPDEPKAEYVAQAVEFAPGVEGGIKDAGVVGGFEISPDAGELNLNANSPVAHVAEATAGGEGKFIIDDNLVHVVPAPQPQKRIVIKNKRQALLHTYVLITALEEALDYDPAKCTAARF
jgi:hypothetical protein